MNYELDIRNINGDYCYYKFRLNIIKENSRSIYAKGYYGEIFRLEKKSCKVYEDGNLIGNTCEWEVCEPYPFARIQRV